MAKFTVIHWQGSAGEEPIEDTFGDPRQALAFAAEAGSGVTITGPDDVPYHVSDFEIALGRGAFD